jgi:hypothetical protein
MMRRIEYAAGASALVLSILTLLNVLFVPFVCTVTPDSNGKCPSNTYRTFAQSGAPASFWILVLCVLLLIGSGAAAAVAETRFNRPQYAPVLWAGAILSLAACAFSIGALGPFYLVSVMALEAAAYTSILARIRARREATQPPSSPDAIVPGEPNA